MKTGLLHRAYPFNYHRIGHSTSICIGVGIFIFLFTLIVRPYEAQDVVTGISPLQISFAYSSAAAVNCAFFLIILPLLFNRYFREEKWTVGKEIFWIGLLLLSISLCNYALCQILFRPEVIAKMGQATIFGQTLLTTFFIGMIPTIVIVLLNQIRLVKMHSGYQEIEQNIRSADKVNGSLVQLRGDNINEVLEIEFQDFFFAQAEGNYVEVRFKNGTAVEKKVLRSTLTNLEEQLAEFEEIKRVHRKYLANFSTVARVSGNAQGYKLHYQSSLLVPVSRQKSKELFG